MTVQPRIDHLGREYPSLKAMCEAYGLTTKAYSHRIRRGWPLEKALTTPLGSAHIVYDHKNNRFESARDMCRAYHVNADTYYRRRKSGMSIEEALTAPDRSGRKAIGQNGMASEDAPLAPAKRYAVTDPDGKAFPSITAMCRSRNIPVTTYRSRIRNGFTQEDALNPNYNPHQVSGIYDDAYRNLRDFLKTYHITRKQYALIRKEKTEEQYKGKMMRSLKAQTDISDRLRIVGHVEDGYYSVLYDGREDVWKHRKIIDESRRFLCLEPSYDKAVKTT